MGFFNAKASIAKVETPSLRLMAITLHCGVGLSVVQAWNSGLA